MLKSTQTRKKHEIRNLATQIQRVLTDQKFQWQVEYDLDIEVEDEDDQDERALYASRCESSDDMSLWLTRNC